MRYLATTSPWVRALGGEELLSETGRTVALGARCLGVWGLVPQNVCMVRQLVGVVLVALVPLVAGLPAMGQQSPDPDAAGRPSQGASPEEPSGFQRVVDITFPVAGAATYTDDYHAFRGGGTRRHQATDVFADKLQRIHAAAAARCA